jgi:hypothetical protein
MPAPTVVAVTPIANSTDVVLGAPIVVTFDQLIDITTVSDATFSLQGPGQTQILDPSQILLSAPDIATGREYITGTFVFTVDGQNRSVVTFTPGKPLRPNLQYTVLILGGSGLITAVGVKAADGSAMASSFTWSFSTGVLNLSAPPPSSPLLDDIPFIDPATIKIVPRQLINQNIDAGWVLDIVFPSTIDQNSFQLSDLLLSLEPVLGSLDIVVPANLQPTVTFPTLGNILRITIQTV